MYIIGKSFSIVLARKKAEQRFVFDQKIIIFLSVVDVVKRCFDVHGGENQKSGRGSSNERNFFVSATSTNTERISEVNSINCPNPNAIG